MGRRLRTIDWDAVAGIVAAVAALLLHLLHVVETDVLLAIALVILAVMLLRDLRREGREDEDADRLARVEVVLDGMRADLRRQDVELVGPPHLRSASEEFGEQAIGDAVWFNVCLSMFIPQSLFNALLRPMVENPRVTSIQFILDHSERETWERHVLPKLAVCSGKASVLDPVWCDLHESVSCILAETRAGQGVSALLSFWGEPFMARHGPQDVPRYIFRVFPDSELVQRLRELERSYRFGRTSPTV
jgi:hypothetical protein